MRLPIYVKTLEIVHMAPLFRDVKGVRTPFSRGYEVYADDVLIAVVDDYHVMPWMED